MAAVGEHRFQGFLAPAGAAVVARFVPCSSSGTISFAVLFLPGEVARLRDDLVAALAYVTNWLLIFNQESYFEAAGRPSLLQHLWSLAVEEQFYILWPLLLAAGLAFLPRPLLAAGGARRRGFFLGV